MVAGNARKTHSKIFVFSGVIAAKYRDALPFEEVWELFWKHALFRDAAVICVAIYQNRVMNCAEKARKVVRNRIPGRADVGSAFISESEEVEKILVYRASASECQDGVSWFIFGGDRVDDGLAVQQARGWAPIRNEKDHSGDSVTRRSLNDGPDGAVHVRLPKRAQVAHEVQRRLFLFRACLHKSPFQARCRVSEHNKIKAVFRAQTV